MTNTAPLVKSDADDIQSLTNQLETGAFSYVDIALTDAWRQALEQWPLLAEWNEWSAKDQS